MKPITALLLLSLAGAGAACSDTVSGAAETEAATETAGAGSEVQGTLNLNIGRAPDQPGRPIVGANTGSANGGLIVAPGTAGGNFEGVEELGIEIEESPEAILEPEETSGEDELVRIPEKR